MISATGRRSAQSSWNAWSAIIVTDLAEPMESDREIPQQSSHDGPNELLSIMMERCFTHAERNYQVLLSDAVFFAPVHELIQTCAFRWFGSISSSTPVYSLKPPFLFYVEETTDKETGFYFSHSDSIIAAIADNLSMMNEELLRRYNTELVFMPIPNKYTIYHTMVNSDTYDDFIPRLCTEAEQRGVKTIRMYERFKNSNDILYLPTDSHWNERGMMMALEEALRVLRSSNGERIGK